MTKQIHEMTRDELRKEAKRLSIDGRGRMSKNQLLAAVVVALANQKKSKPAKVKKVKSTPRKETKTKKKTQPQLSNHIAIVLDASSSMWSYRQEAVDVFNKQLATLQKAAKENKQKTTLTLITFNQYTRVHFSRKPIEECKPLTVHQYRPQGMTALYDAVDEASSKLGMAGDRDDLHTSFLVLAITDGQENCSCRMTGETLGQSIRKAQGTDRWTYAFLLPGKEKQFAKMLGLPAGNCARWEVSELGIKQMGDLSTQSLTNYYGARAQGATRSTNFFTTNLADVSKEEMRKKLTDLSPKVREATVDERMEIRDFCQKRFGEYKKGGAFYLLMKAETIQNYKQILVMEKNGSQIYGGQEARDLLKLPDYAVRVHPGNHGDFLIFVQSTSVNRKVIPGTRLLYAPSLV